MKKNKMLIGLAVFSTWMQIGCWQKKSGSQLDVDKPTQWARTEKYGTHHISSEGRLMRIDDVCKRWGTAPLDLKKFKQAENNPSVRASMACSLIKNSAPYIGKSVLEIRQLFGEHDGHYFRDSIPAYMIQMANSTTPDSWQIVFLQGGKNKKIAEIVVNKNN